MRNQFAGFTFALVAVLLSGTSACKRESYAAGHERSAEAVDPLKVQVTPELLQMISVGKPQWQQVTTEQKVAARTQTDASRVARIGSSVDGRITKVLVFEGQYVRQGQVLAMLHSNALSDTQFAFIKAFSQETLAEQAAERARQLVQSDVIGKAELQSAKQRCCKTVPKSRRFMPNSMALACLRAPSNSLNPLAS